MNVMVIFNSSHDGLQALCLKNTFAALFDIKIAKNISAVNIQIIHNNYTYDMGNHKIDKIESMVMK